MFETMSDAEVVSAISDQARAAAAADAHRLGAIAELLTRRLDFDDDERDHWACDFWDAAAAEVAAALGVTRHTASRDMQIALALRVRLPKIAALYAQGRISSRVVATITWRTRLVEDTDALAAIDADLAGRAERFGLLSDHRLQLAIDHAVDTHDPGALLRTQIAARSRDVNFGDDNDTSGVTSVWGRLMAADAALLKKRLNEMAHQVCADDPRTIGQRRADALGVLGAGGHRLACLCGNPACPAAAVEDARAASVVIHVITESATLDAEPDPHMSGPHHSRQVAGSEVVPETAGGDTADGGSGDTADEERENVAAQSAAPTTDSPDSTDAADDRVDAGAAEPAPDNTAEPVVAAPRRKCPPALLLGGGTIPAPLLAELLRNGARLQPIRAPGADPEQRYRPSAALADYIRMRDMTCRFPGCGRSAEYADIDHTLAHPAGPTHPSNLACLCRHHHLLKTFWDGADGWAERQTCEGAITWTAPTGHTYTTHPGSRLFFPDWATTTREVPLTTPQVASPLDRGVMMPRRKRTRAQDRNQRRKAERALNDDYVALRNKPPPM